MYVERDIQKIRRRLAAEGWAVRRAEGPHEVYRHPEKRGRVVAPRGRGDLSIATARSIAKAAGWSGKDALE